MHSPITRTACRYRDRGDSQHRCDRGGEGGRPVPPAPKPLTPPAGPSLPQSSSNDDDYKRFAGDAARSHVTVSAPAAVVAAAASVYHARRPGPSRRGSEIIPSCSLAHSRAPRQPAGGVSAASDGGDWRRRRAPSPLNRTHPSHHHRHPSVPRSLARSLPQWPRHLNSGLETVDPELYDIIEHEKNRQVRTGPSILVSCSTQFV